MNSICVTSFQLLVDWRARKICTPAVVDDKERIIREISRQDSHFDRFIQIYYRPNNHRKLFGNQKEKCIREFALQNGPLHQKRKSALDRIDPAAQIRRFASTNFVSIQMNHLSVNGLSASHTIYQFTCSCDEEYIGRINQCLAQEMAWNIRQYLLKAMSENWIVQQWNRALC